MRSPLYTARELIEEKGGVEKRSEIDGKNEKKTKASKK